MRRFFENSARIVAVAAVIAALGLAAIRLYALHELRDSVARFEAEVGPLDTPEAIPVPLAQNGALWVLAAARKIPAAGAKIETLRHLAATPGSRWSAEEQRTGREVREENAPAFKLLEPAAKLQDWMAPAGEASGPRTAASSADLIRLGRALLIEGRLSLLEGRREQAASVVDQLGRVVIMERRSPLLIRQLVGGILERQFLQAILAFCDQATPSARELTDLGRRIETLRRLANSDRWIASEAALSDGAFRETVGWSQLWDGSLRALIIADTLSEERKFAAAAARPWPELTRWAEDEQALLRAGWARKWPYRLTPARAISAIGYSMLLPNLVGALAKEKATQSARGVASLALVASQEGLTPQEVEARLALLPPDPWTAGKISFTRESGGALFLEVTGAVDRWKEHDQRTTPPPFRWPLLPPPAAPL